MTDVGKRLKRAQQIEEGRQRAADGSGRRLRLAAGMTLDDIAELVGVHKSQVSRWEAGTTAPRRSAAVRYAKVIAGLAKACGEKGERQAA